MAELYALAMRSWSYGERELPSEQNAGPGQASWTSASRWAAEPERKGKRRLRDDLVTFVLSTPVRRN